MALAPAPRAPRAPRAPARRAPARQAPPRRAPIPLLPARPMPGRRPPPVVRAPAKRAHPRGAAVLDALLHGRGWIALVFVLLAGIVFFNVDLLRMNREIAATATAASDMKRDNARLRALTARLGSSERIQEVAARAGLALPAPGEVRYLRSDPSEDGDDAARRLEEDPGVAVAPPVPVPIEPTEAIEPIDPTEPVSVPVEPEPLEPVVEEVAPTIDPVTGVPIDPATGAPAG